MLRISYSNSAEGQHWNLCGRLAGPWVDELRSFWRHTRDAVAASRAVMDLSDVTFIDPNGEKLLSEMSGEGVAFVARGVETKHLIEHLKSAEERQAPCAETRRAKNKTNGRHQ
jgi:hypothetical protein